MIRRLRHFFNNATLRTKVLLTYLLIISIPLTFISVFLYTQVNSMLISSTIRSGQEKTADTAPEIENLLNQISLDFSKFESLPFVQNLFDRSQENASLSLSQSDYFPDFNSETNALISESYIDYFRIYVDLPESVLKPLTKASENVVLPLDDVHTAYWKGIFSGTKCSSLHCPAMYLTSSEKESYGDAAYIMKFTIRLNRTYCDCYIAAYYSSSVYEQVLENTLPVEGSVSYIINDREAIVTTTDTALSGIYHLDYSSCAEYFRSSNNFLKKTVLGEDIYACIYNIGDPNWYMIVVIPSDPLIEESNTIMSYYILLFALSILLAVVVAVMISKSLTSRLSLVSRQMAKIRTNPPEPLAPPEIHDEIGGLIETYNYMCSMMNHLLWEQARVSGELRVSEFNSLQAQINPHFLYNTMDMINWMAAQGRTSEIAEVVQNLSRFYKLTLSKKETISTIENEIEHVSLYVRLQNMRFHDAIDFVVDMPDELLERPIPKLTLQPVVENAILHGIMEKESHSGTIVLTGWVEDQTIVLLISDDGVGMTEEVLQNILRENDISGDPRRRSKTDAGPATASTASGTVYDDSVTVSNDSDRLSAGFLTVSTGSDTVSAGSLTVPTGSDTVSAGSLTVVTASAATSARPSASAKSAIKRPHKGSNIAIYNTHHRIQILFGKEYGLSYKSSPGSGTEVSIRIPLHSEKWIRKTSGFYGADSIPDEDILPNNLAMALELLRQPNSNVYNVAVACGYTDPDQFLQDFQKEFHISPFRFQNYTQ